MSAFETVNVRFGSTQATILLNILIFHGHLGMRGFTI
jgi:hypothetical protein